jgi:hypothetical protein
MRWAHRKLHRTSTMLAARALTTDRSMHPGDLQEGRGSKHALRRSALSRRLVRLQADDDARQKPLDWDGPVTEVRTLKEPFSLSIGATLANCASQQRV